MKEQKERKKLVFVTTTMSMRYSVIHRESDIPKSYLFFLLYYCSESNLAAMINTITISNFGEKKYISYYTSGQNHIIGEVRAGIQDRKLEVGPEAETMEKCC